MGTQDTIKLELDSTARLVSDCELYEGKKLRYLDVHYEIVSAHPEESYLLVKERL